MKEDNKLALLGGKKTINKPFVRYNPIAIEEKSAAIKVIESGVLSKFLGTWGPDFFGGPKVQEVERLCESFFGVRHAVVVNSWTSGLIAAVGAIGIEPGDEVIVTTWTMCASATAILHWNAIPVFADIDPNTYCLDPKSIELNITPQTKAIMVVDIFGHSADMKSILNIAKKHNLKVISDTAQAPGAMYYGEYAGTLADIGGYSLNYHKHIHTGDETLYLSSLKSIKAANFMEYNLSKIDEHLDDLSKNEFINLFYSSYPTMQQTNEELVSIFYFHNLTF